MRWKIFIALLLMMLLYSGCRKVTGKIEIKPDKIEFPASGGRAVIKITKGSVTPCEIDFQDRNFITWCRVESENPYKKRDASYYSVRSK